MPTEQGGFSQPAMGNSEIMDALKSKGVLSDEAPQSELKEMSNVQKIKQLRQDGDSLIQRVKSLPPSRELSLVVTKLQEGVMWLGMELKRMNEPNPYPSSKDPNTGDKIEPTADGLKL